jgi:hypothetical protein
VIHIKYLGINITKEAKPPLKTKKILRKLIEEDTRR